MPASQNPHLDRYLCLHLHFYQPPRENPWLGEIEYQESAYPFHDWNERINSECYRANGQSRILDSTGRVVDLANNYAKVSFNFGPTLLSWMEENDQLTYGRILEGDQLSLKYFGGHGSAIAQAYNHVIMPLANRRDKETQVVWGLRDFERRFRRPAESMWLPETAVDIETLEILSDHGMKYVVLAPRQAKAFRPINSDQAWQDVPNETIDPKRPYLVKLPSGRSIVAFFYDGAISKAVAFEGLLHNGETFANRLIQGFSSDKKSTQLLHIATDGETYGHHHLNGDMALAYAIHHLEKNKLATITNYGQFLELNPPQFEAQIHENSSWSCAHGIERWRSNCGCNSGTKSNWHQRWREPVRNALDFAREQLEKPFESLMRQYMDDPWGARNEYIKIIDDRSLANIEVHLKKWCRIKEIADEDKTKILKALESQRHALLMYTSCAWFFDEVSGIETVQNLQYAYRAIELGEAVFGINILGEFVNQLEKAESNISDVGNGRVAFERYVLPAKVDYLRVGIHFAVSSIFETFGEKNEVYKNRIMLEEFSRFESGKAKMACGQAKIRSRITLERQRMTFGVVHLGDHNVSAGIKFYESDDNYQSLLSESRAAFDKADFPAVIRVFDRYFGQQSYSLRDLFKDEQRKIVDIIMSETMQETEERFSRLYRGNYPLLCYLSDLHFPLPHVFSHVAEFVQNRGIRRELLSEKRIRTDVIKTYLEEARSWNVPLDAGLARTLEAVLESRTRDLDMEAQNLEKLEELLDLVLISNEFPFKTNLGPVQNWFFLFYRERALTWSKAMTPDNKRWHEIVERLGLELHVELRDLSSEGANVSGDVPTSAAQELSIH